VKGYGTLRISIVTPSFQQAAYIEQTIESVLSQKYADLEFIVIDGGSSDGTVDILKRYDKHFTYWVSEKDRGQTHAINKGLSRVTGQVWAFLNSDDLLRPGSLHTVGRMFGAQPDLDWVSGCTDVFGDDIDSWQLVPSNCEQMLHYLTPWERPMLHIFPASVSCFMSRRVLDKIGLFDESLHYSMDIEYYVRAVFAGFRQTITNDILGAWRWHPAAKTWTIGSAYGFREDEITIARRFMDRLSPKDREELANQLRVQAKGLHSRTAMWHLEQGNRWRALQELVRGARALPSSLWFRPWLGALRRSILPK
jgi:glycosyltransferase involved in cell wall biosynthesis